MPYMPGAGCLLAVAFAFSDKAGAGGHGVPPSSLTMMRRASTRASTADLVDGKLALLERSPLAGRGTLNRSPKRSPPTSKRDKLSLPVNQSFEQWVSTANLADPFGAPLVNALLPFIELEHPVPLQPCPDAHEATVTAADCGRDKEIFSGLREGGPAFVIDVSVLGFDLDLFELRLQELENSVDLFCVIEMPITHRGIEKPLLWARNKDKPRFAKFRDRVMHVVVEDEQTLRFLHRMHQVRFEPVVWLYEGEQERAGKAKLHKMLKEVYAKLKRGQEAVMSYGHVDEIPSPRNLALMKHCQPRKYPVDSGAWMPMGRFDRAFRSDIPVRKDLPFTYGNPSFHDPNVSMYRTLGHSGRFLLGGWHMTQSAYPPLNMVKDLTCTECKGWIDYDDAVLLGGPQGARAYFDKISSLERWPAYLNRTVLVADLKANSTAPYKDRPDLLEPPRVVRCNPDRYEIWFGRYDRRLTMPLSS